MCVCNTCHTYSVTLWQNVCVANMQFVIWFLLGIKKQKLALNLKRGTLGFKSHCDCERLWGLLNWADWIYFTLRSSLEAPDDMNRMLQLEGEMSLHSFQHWFLEMVLLRKLWKTLKKRHITEISGSWGRHSSFIDQSHFLFRLFPECWYRVTSPLQPSAIMSFVSAAMMSYKCKSNIFSPHF